MSDTILKWLLIVGVAMIGLGFIAPFVGLHEWGILLPIGLSIWVAIGWHLRRQRRPTPQEGE